jgi:FkbM family methyltransferase
MLGNILTSKTARRFIASAPRGKSRVGRLISRRYPKAQVFNLVGPLAGISMYLDTSDPFQAEMAYGAYQPDLIYKMLSLARPGDVVLTAGAHLGYVPLALAKAVGPTGKVIAFEADPRMVKDCGRNLALNKVENIVRLAPVGLGSANGELEMSLSSTAGQSSFAIAHHYLRSVTVALRKGDGILAELGINKIDGLLLDVEGWEMQVLDGLSNTLSNDLPRWAIIECWDVALRNAGSAAKDLLQKLRSLGWEISGVDGGLARDGCDIVCTRLKT